MQCFAFYSLICGPSAVHVGGVRVWVPPLFDKYSNPGVCRWLGSIKWILGWNAEKYWNCRGLLWSDRPQNTRGEVPWLSIQPTKDFHTISDCLAWTISSTALNMTLKFLAREGYLSSFESGSVHICGHNTYICESSKNYCKTLIYCKQTDLSFFLRWELDPNESEGERWERPDGA